MPRRVSSPIFVGRVAERAALADALERAAAAQPGAVLIAGEAGVGKTRLLGELTAAAAASGVRVEAGACIDVAVGTLAYGPFLELVRGLHRAGIAARLPASTRAELARLVPEVAPQRADVDEQGPTGPGGQGRLFAAVRDLLAAASQASPLLVTIEDLHWADGSTLDLVTYLARSMQSDRLLLVMTARLDTLPRGHPLVRVVAELSRLPWLERVDLARFDEGELAQQLTGILGRPPDPTTAHQVFERSDGNAFFAEELVAAGAAGGAMPASLREVLAARLETLSDASQAIVRVAAVVGRVVDHDLLARIAPVAPPVLLAALREAVEQRVLQHVTEPAPGYAFRHALLREAAYDELLPAERVALHQAIADALESDEPASGGSTLGRTGEIAFHAMAANDPARALAASCAAVTVAEQASAWAEAEVHLERIREIWPRVADAPSTVGMDRAELVARTARAAAAAGHQGRAAELGAQALAEVDPGDPDRRVAALLDLFDYAWEAGDIGTAERVVVEALPMVRDERSARSSRACVADALLRWSLGRYTSARDAASAAISIARECGADRELTRALTVLGQVLTHLGETAHAEESFAAAARVSEGLSDPDARARLNRWRAWARLMHGRFEESLALNRLGLEIAQREGSGRYGVNFLDGVVENLVELGRWSEAQAVADQILTGVAVSHEMVYTHMTLARMYTLMGRIDDAQRQIAQAEVAAVGPHRVWQIEDAVFLAYASGRHADGRRFLESALAESLEPERDATLWWPLLKAIGGEADRAAAARRRRRTPEVEDAVQSGHGFAALLRRSVTAALEADGAGPLARATLLGADAEEARLDGEADPERWEAVVTARIETGQPWEAAYARYRQAEAILARGRPSADAAPILREAHASARGLGATPLRASIEELASRARIQLDDGTQHGGPAGAGEGTTLTARELEVLTLVAAGHTNREIGERLFISEKTASVHVTHAMDKLGALSRYEAAALATRMGLLEPGAGP